MPITNSWADDSKTILINEFPQSWTWEEFVKACLTGYEMVGEVGHTTYIVAKNFNNTPKGNAMGAFKRVEDFPQSLGLLIIQSDSMNSVGITMINVFLRVYGRQAGKILYVKTMNDALRLIDKHRQTASKAAVS